jgi:hypothetical protein
MARAAEPPGKAGIIIQMSRPDGSLFDFDGPPPSGAWSKYGLGIILPLGLCFYAVWILASGTAEFSDGRISMTLRGTNATAFAIELMAVGIFLHCQCFWGNIYDQIWIATIGKIISLCAFVFATGFLCIHAGLLGHN